MFGASPRREKSQCYDFESTEVGDHHQNDFRSGSTVRSKALFYCHSLSR